MRCTFPAGIATWSSSANSGHVAIAARIERRAAPYKGLEDWAQMYGGNLLIVLPDCFGTTSFLRELLK